MPLLTEEQKRLMGIEPREFGGLPAMFRLSEGVENSQDLDEYGYRRRGGGKKAKKQRWMKAFDDAIQELNPKIKQRQDYWDTAAHLFNQGMDPKKAAQQVASHPQEFCPASRRGEIAPMSMTAPDQLRISPWAQRKNSSVEAPTGPSLSEAKRKPAKKKAAKKKATKRGKKTETRRRSLSLFRSTDEMVGALGRAHKLVQRVNATIHRDRTSSSSGMMNEKARADLYRLDQEMATALDSINAASEALDSIERANVAAQKEARQRKRQGRMESVGRPIMLKDIRQLEKLTGPLTIQQAPGAPGTHKHGDYWFTDGDGQLYRFIPKNDRDEKRMDRYMGFGHLHQQMESTEMLMYEESYSQEELAILASFYQHKPFYRKKVFDELGLGAYGPDNQHVKSLIDKGLIKMRGKNMMLNKKKALEVMKQNPAPAKYTKGGWLDNYRSYFKKESIGGDAPWIL